MALLKAIPGSVGLRSVTLFLDSILRSLRRGSEPPTHLCSSHLVFSCKKLQVSFETMAMWCAWQLGQSSWRL